MSVNVSLAGDQSGEIRKDLEDYSNQNGYKCMVTDSRRNKGFENKFNQLSGNIFESTRKPRAASDKLKEDHAGKHRQWMEVGPGEEVQLYLYPCCACLLHDFDTDVGVVFTGRSDNTDTKCQQK
jgi:hypothetical protein